MFCIVFWTAVLLCFSTVSANTEKVIFLGPDNVETFNAHPNLQDLNIETISPASSSSSSLRTHLPVAFPSRESQRGVDSWYLLKELEPGSRYEVRVCWAAIVSHRVCCDDNGHGIILFVELDRCQTTSCADCESSSLPNSG